MKRSLGTKKLHCDGRTPSYRKLKKKINLIGQFEGLDQLAGHAFLVLREEERVGEALVSRSTSATASENIWFFFALFFFNLLFLKRENEKKKN